jgi:hypothetical protein
VIKKAVAYALEDEFWPSPEDVGALGVARFVLEGALLRAPLRADAEAVKARLGAFLDRAETLEPSDVELELAAALELEAQKAGLPLDGGESQLAAITVGRKLEALETGDKRAIGALEVLLNYAGELAWLAARVRCLEQIAFELSAQVEFGDLCSSICAEPEVDKALSASFSCASGGAQHAADAQAGLRSYIEDLRRVAPRLLEPGPSP